MSGSAEKRMVPMLERLVDHLLVRSSPESKESDMSHIRACNVRKIFILFSEQKTS